MTKSFARDRLSQLQKADVPNFIPEALNLMPAYSYIYIKFRIIHVLVVDIKLHVS